MRGNSGKGQARWYWGLIVLLLVGGCGKSDGRQLLEGTVTLDGDPLANGSITFRPLAGTAGPTAGAEIAEGHFYVKSEKGTFSGTFRVAITATRLTGKKVMGLDLVMIDESEQFIPVRYNRQSELTAEVTEDGPNQFDFALISK